jgi:hypothetical protein
MLSRRTERWAAKVSTASSLRIAVPRSSVAVALVALLLSTLAWAREPTNAQALRTCVDRWNQSQMVGWGPGPANVAFRRPNEKEHSSIQLSSRRQCIVATPAGDGTWTCVLSSTGAYWCPPLHEATGPRLRENATLNRRGVLELDSPLKGTHPPPPLPWQRYPRVDGYIHPWTPSGKLRSGLHFKGKQRGRCFLVDETARSAVSCLAGNSRYDACFPRRRPWQRGELAACSFGPGSRTFTRWVITQGSDPPIFVPWSRIGDISLGAYKEEAEAEYGSVGHGFHVIQRYGKNVQGYYRLHGTRVVVTFYGDKVGEIEFSTPYYRAKNGFGVGSRISLGPCHRTMGYRCLHLWHGFMWNLRLREKPCSCWVKVGRGPRSLPATGDNFLKPWFFINVKRGRISSFYFALKFVD